METDVKNAALKDEAVNQINAYKAADKFYDHNRLMSHVYDQFAADNGFTTVFNDERKSNIYQYKNVL